MFARFFIDRPIFSWVISLVILLVGVVAVLVLPIAQYPDITPPTVTVTAQYPGANAQVVADSVAAPIEQQVSGVDRMLYMSSQCTNDGTYTLTITFDLGTDPNTNQVLVQNRAALAQAQLPQQVQIQGVSTKKRSPSILFVVNLVSPDGTYDDLYLSNYATLQIKDAQGLDLNEVTSTLQVYMGMTFVNLFNHRFGRTWQVNVSADQRFRTDAKYLRRLEIRNRQGKMVPFGTVAEVKPISGPIIVTRYNLYAAASVQIMTAPGVTSSAAIAALDSSAEKLRTPVEYSEIAYLELKAGDKTLVIFGLGSLLIYLVLAAQYESWSLPLAVILILPLCLLCAIAGMFIVKLPVDIFVQIGFLVLVGLAAKNAILIVEFARQLQANGKSAREAAVEAAGVRLRPIIMTSFAFILGVFPLVIGEGAGAEMRRSMGTAVFSGMIGVTVFGIFLTPVFYFVVQWMTGGTVPKASAGELAEPSKDGHADGVAPAKSEGFRTPE